MKSREDITEKLDSECGFIFYESSTIHAISFSTTMALLHSPTNSRRYGIFMLFAKKIVLCFSTTKSKWFAERQKTPMYVNIYEAQESIKFAFEKLLCTLDLKLLSSTAE